MGAVGGGAGFMGGGAVFVSCFEERNMERKKIEGLKRRVRELLKGGGAYTREMTYQVEMLAADLLVYRKMLDEALGSDVMIREVSREGNERVRVNPLYELLAKQSDVVRRDLKALGMNKELRWVNDALMNGAEGDDPLARLMQDAEKEG